MINIQSFGSRDRGRRRKNNEDFVTSFQPTDPAEIESSGCLYILADGVGGAAKGERASEYAAQKVLFGYYQQPDVEPGERLRRLMTQASYEIFSHAEQSGRISRMATTMVAVVVHADRLIVAHVGDSRAYLIRGGVATQLTRDHSIVGEMVANGDMTEAEAQASKIKNRLTRSIGGEPDVHVDVLTPIPLQPGDKVLLCSDGLTRYALREDIARLTTEGSPQEIVERAIKFANQRGGADNISVIAITLGASEIPAAATAVARPLQPPDIEDTLNTEPDVSRYRKPKSRLNKTALMTMVAAGGILIFSIAIFGIGSVFFPVTTPTTTQAVIGVLPTSITTDSPAPTIDISMTPSPTAEGSSFVVIQCPDGVRVREAPSRISTEIYTPIPNGEKVTITHLAAYENKNDDSPLVLWLQIYYSPNSDKTGWIVQSDGAIVCVNVTPVRLTLTVPPNVKSTETATSTPTSTTTFTLTPPLPSFTPIATMTTGELNMQIVTTPAP